MTELERVVHALEQVTPFYIDEYTLQAQLEDALELAGITTIREYRLTEHDRIDLLAIIADSTIGIEVKIAGHRDDVLRQLTRYADHPSLDALILVTTVAKHHRLPTELNGKPLRLVTYVTAGL